MESKDNIKGMPRKTRAMFQMWSKTQEYKKKIRHAKEMTHQAIHNHPCILLYSGGKDSLVLLHMALQVEPDIPVYHFSAGNDYESKQIKQP